MANRLALHRRASVAALLLLFVAVTMLATANGLDIGGEERAAEDGVAPVGSGVTHTAATEAEWDAAVAAAVPGDVIRLTATINARLVYRGDNDGGTATGAHGTAGSPIVITADPGVWIDPGDQSSGFGALDILHVNHVHAVGVNVRNAQFGIRCMQCHGSAGNPIRIAESTVTSIGHAGINVAGHWSTHAPSSHVLVEDNVVTYTGQTHPEFGEGVYIGYGSVEWVDVTSDVEITGNDISYTGAEGIDIKPGTRDITASGNFIHDLAPISGGAISAHYVNATPNPHPTQLDQVTITGNRIWNVNLTGTSGSNDWAIWVGHGGVDVIGNTIWGLRDLPGSARGIRVRATQDFGPHPINIRDNVFWAAQGWLAEGTPSGASNVVASGNYGVTAGSSEIQVTAADFVGPVPALGVSGTADAGSGPGSGFALAGGGATTTTTAPTTTTTTSSTTTTAPTTTAAPTSTTAPTTTVPVTVGGSTTPTLEVPSTTTTAQPSTTPTTADPAEGLDQAATTTTVFKLPDRLEPDPDPDTGTTRPDEVEIPWELAFVEGSIGSLAESATDPHGLPSGVSGSVGPADSRGSTPGPHDLELTPERARGGDPAGDGEGEVALADGVDPAGSDQEHWVPLVVAALATAAVIAGGGVVMTLRGR
ncbi:MAG: right-handed parallel beta-helix repeat-containing protein [Actinomycetota bacterium]